MSISTISVGPNGLGQTVTLNLVSMPAILGAKEITFGAMDTVATLTSPFTGMTQRQAWPGADLWSATVTLPNMTRRQASLWKAFLLEMRGMLNAVLLSDPEAQSPMGTVTQESAPVANTDGGTGYNAAGTTTLYTRGWVANGFRLLMPDDKLQIGYRLHSVLDVVNSDANGDAAISIWPSLRETPADGEAIVLNKPAGLFSLASNYRSWNVQIPGLTSISFQLSEYR